MAHTLDEEYKQCLKDLNRLLPSLTRKRTALHMLEAKAAAGEVTQDEEDRDAAESRPE
jgi:hypothetical protein